MAILLIWKPKQTLLPMVLILDGNSECVAHACRKIGLCEEIDQAGVHNWNGKWHY